MTNHLGARPKIAPADAIEIRETLLNGWQENGRKITVKKLARRHRVSEFTIRQVLNAVGAYRYLRTEKNDTTTKEAEDRMVKEIEQMTADRGPRLTEQEILCLLTALDKNRTPDDAEISARRKLYQMLVLR